MSIVIGKRQRSLAALILEVHIGSLGAECYDHGFDPLQGFLQKFTANFIVWHDH